MDRTEFMSVVYDELQSDADNSRANRIIDAADEYADSMAAADVVPVVHGVWHDGYRVQTCSVCKGKGKKSWKFCPYCGADMRGGKQDERPD